jgi:hypothetical protein
MMRLPRHCDALDVRRIARNFACIASERFWTVCAQMGYSSFFGGIQVFPLTGYPPPAHYYCGV